MDTYDGRVTGSTFMTFWVERDPLEARSVDALGMGTIADRISDELLPGLSILTRRARYFSLLTWARSRIGSSQDVATAAHRWEATLSVAEHQWHKSASDQRCSFLGKNKLAGRSDVAKPPSDPTSIYKVSAWSQYRASMVSLGLLDRAGTWRVVGDDACRLARAYSTTVRGARIDRPLPVDGILCAPPSSAERKLLLKALLYADCRFAERRRETLRATRALLASGVAGVLERARNASSRQPVRLVLAAARVWEHLSVGLHAIFLHALKLREGGGGLNTFAKQLDKAHPRKGVPLREVDTSADSDTLAHTARGHVRRARRLLAWLPEAGRELVEREESSIHWAVARQVDKRELSGAELLERLHLRHVDAKGDGAWIERTARGWMLRDDRRRELPQRARLHTYRLSAFASLMADLGQL